MRPTERLVLDTSAYSHLRAGYLEEMMEAMQAQREETRTQHQETMRALNTQHEATMHALRALITRTA